MCFASVFQVTYTAQYTNCLNAVIRQVFYSLMHSISTPNT